jgi:alkylhydroperoxidase/carboxymuconolactone decarboxylase family protein YurZ
MQISDELGAGAIHSDVQEAIGRELDARLHGLLSDHASGERSVRWLSRKDKELILMALACVQERASQAELHARAAMMTGATLSEVVEVAVLTIIERGMPQFKRAGLHAIQAAEHLAGQQSRYARKDHPSPDPHGDRMREIRCYVRETLGVDMPDMFVKLESLAPYALDGYMRIRQGVLHDHGAATKWLKELVMTSMDILLGNSWGAPIHGKQAMHDGASGQQLVEAVALAMIEGGLNVYRTGGEDVLRLTQAARSE